MDQGPLVTEKIEAGRKLATAFDHYHPLAAAFWLKKVEDGEWYLYLASEEINDANNRRAYQEVIRILGTGPRPWLDASQVIVIGTDQLIAKEIIEQINDHASGYDFRLQYLVIGGVYADEVYIYSLPAPVPA